MKKLNGNNAKTKMSIIALILMLTISALLVALPSVSAQQPTKEMYPYIGAIPNPVGVNQELLLHVGVTDQVDWIHGGWQGLTVTVTKPDGSTETLGPVTTDLTGGTGVLYIPTEVGTYTFVTNFPEQVVETPQRSIPEPNTLLFAASSPPLEVTVQAEPLVYYPGFALPDFYWTRPIDANIREWNDIAGSWLTSPDNLIAVGNDNAPDTAHVLWTTDLAMGGWVGGTTPYVMEIGDAYEGKFNGALIVNGILYYPDNNYQGRGSTPMENLDIVAVDLHTGEQLWSRPLLDLDNETRPLSFAQNFYWDSFNGHGVYSYLWTTSGRDYNAYDAFTGDWAYTLQNVPSGSRYYGADGEFYIVTVDLENGWISQWNSTRAVNPQDTNSSIDGSWGRYFGTYGRIIDATETGFDWNVTIPTNFPGGLNRGEPVQLVGDRVVIANVGGRSTYPGETVTVSAISIAPATRGQLLYSTTWDSPDGWVEGNQVVEWMCWDAETMMATLYAREKGENFGVDLETGQLAWGPTTPPENYLNSLDDTKSGARLIYDGKLYSASVSGIVYCWDVETGESVWITPIEDTYSEILWANTWWARPLFIADDKIYVGSYEHSPINPRPRGAPFSCLDAQTGEYVWRADGIFRQTRWGGRALIGDSIIATMDTYDQRIYAIGKGPSKTTVSAPESAQMLGAPVLVTGTVTDVSPGTNDPAITMRFPNGVGAVADEDMSEWMTFVYKQFTFPSDTKGVEVVLTTLDPNGNYYEVGRATSDASGFYSVDFTPPVPGRYTIVATFEGTGGYYASQAETALIVSEAASPAQSIEPEPTVPEPTTPEPTTPEPTVPEPTTPEPTEPEPTTPEPTEPEPTTPEPTEPAEAPLITTEIAIIAVVAVVCVIGAVSFWALRKRK